MSESLIPIIPWLGVGGLVIAVITYFLVKRHPAGNESMQEIAETIHKGAMVFLKREYSIIAIFMLVIFAALAYLMGIWTGVAYLCGAICSMFAGWLGMEAATRTSSRTCQGAKDGGTSLALAISFQGGSVMGITVAALGVIVLIVGGLRLTHLIIAGVALVPAVTAIMITKFDYIREQGVEGLCVFMHGVRNRQRGAAGRTTCFGTEALDHRGVLTALDGAGASDDMAGKDHALPTETGYADLSSAHPTIPLPGPWAHSGRPGSPDNACSSLR